jgi:hypothetical protein
MEDGGDQPLARDAQRITMGGTIARRDADGRSAPGPVGQRASGKERGESASGSGQKCRTLRSEAGQSATLEIPAHHFPLLIVTRMGRDYRPGSRQRIERVARRVAPMSLIWSWKIREKRSGRNRGKDGRSGGERRGLIAAFSLARCHLILDLSNYPQHFLRGTAFFLRAMVDFCFSIADRPESRDEMNCRRAI